MEVDVVCDLTGMDGVNRGKDRDDSYPEAKLLLVHPDRVAVPPMEVGTSGVHYLGDLALHRHPWGRVGCFRPPVPP